MATQDKNLKDIKSVAKGSESDSDSNDHLDEQVKRDISVFVVGFFLGIFISSIIFIFWFVFVKEPDTNFVSKKLVKESFCNGGPLEKYLPEDKETDYKLYRCKKNEPE